MSADGTDPEGREGSSLSLFDRYRYAPTREQYRNPESIQHGSYWSSLLFAAFGITSARWDRIARENKHAAEDGRE